MAIGYLARCDCGGPPAVFVLTAGSYVECQRCKRRTQQRRQQARAVEDWREMQKGRHAVQGEDQAECVQERY